MILIGVGANLPGANAHPLESVHQLIDRLPDYGLRLLKSSPFYETPPLGPPGQPPYINAVMRVQACLSPHALIRRLHQIEADFGRTRRIKWGPRTLDLDLLDWHGHVLNGRLVLPHRGIEKRGFVLYPLRDVAPTWHHPETGRSVARLLRDLPVSERLKMRKL